MQMIPIWVIFKRFPMEMWDDEGFSLMGSPVGNPLFTDRLTEERKRTSFTRICVEIEVKCKYPNSVTVVVDEKKAYNLPVEYNWRPPMCSTCQVFGHGMVRCGKNNNHKTSSVWLIKQGAGKETTVDNQAGEKTTVVTPQTASNDDSNGSLQTEHVSSKVSNEGNQDEHNNSNEVGADED